MQCSLNASSCPEPFAPALLRGHCLVSGSFTQKGEALPGPAELAWAPQTSPPQDRHMRTSVLQWRDQHEGSADPLSLQLQSRYGHLAEGLKTGLVHQPAHSRRQRHHSSPTRVPHQHKQGALPHQTYRVSSCGQTDDVVLSGSLIKREGPGTSQQPHIHCT